MFVCCEHANLWVCLDMCTCVCFCVCEHAHLCVCLYVCVYVCVPLCASVRHEHLYVLCVCPRARVCLCRCMCTHTLVLCSFIPIVDSGVHHNRQVTEQPAYDDHDPLTDVPFPPCDPFLSLTSSKL